MPPDPTIEIASVKVGPNASMIFRLRNGTALHPESQDYFPLVMPTLSQLSCADPSVAQGGTTAGPVAAYGVALKSALSTHPAVKQEFDQILLGQSGTLHFAIGAFEAEQIRWETLCEPLQTFFALHANCTIKRVIAAREANDTGRRMFSNPIKMVAFLSPSNVASTGEFAAITGAVAAASNLGLKLQARIYLGEQALLDKATAEIAAGQLPGIEVLPIPSNHLEIEKVIKNEAPQILHFFCHGQVDADTRLLRLASINDHDIDAAEGSISISLERLRLAMEMVGSVWLTVLNSCSGAQAIRLQYSMAASLANYVSPVAIGMADEIQSNQATVFAGALYDSALTILANAIADLRIGQSSIVDFGPAIDAARAALDASDRPDPPRCCCWTLPVLYQRDAPLRVVRMAGPEMQQRIDLVARLLRSLPPGTPIALREELLTVLDKSPAVPPALRPDCFGNL